MKEKESQQLLERVLDGSAPITPVDLVEGRLGYRGFIASAFGETAERLTSEGYPTYFRIRDGLAEEAPTDSAGTESFLMSSAKSDEVGWVQRASWSSPADRRFVDRAAAGMRAPNTGQAENALDDPRYSGTTCRYYTTSWYDFDTWHASVERKRDNNCYNYASNYLSYSYARPGRKAGQAAQPPFGRTLIRDSCIADGWREDCSGANVQIAIVTFNNSFGSDFHFYRRNRNSSGDPRWCHKPGGTSVRNVDDSNNVITSPSSADWGPYTTWGGYLFSGSGHEARWVE